MTAKAKKQEAASPHDEWLDEIDRYERDSHKWESRVKDTLRRYKDERSKTDYSTRFNVLWSNVQTLRPAVYSKDPQPRVTRRHKADDKVAREAGEIFERSLSYGIECWGFGDTMREAVMDRLLPGRGVAWVRYVPHFVATEQTTDDQDEPEQEISYEEVLPDYVHWQDFGHTYARTWEEVRAVWRITYLTREKGIARFGDVFKQVPLDYDPNEDKRAQDKNMTEGMKRACVYEIWDKDTKKVLWLSKNYEEVLDERDDPLGLDGFFPCPKPMFANLSNDTIIPTPDFFQYQDQAREIDELTNRMANIAKSVKVVGAYNGTVEALGRMLEEGVENKLIPVTQWSVFAEKGGLKGAMDLLPVKDIAETYMVLAEAREKVKQDMYEITGLSDIIRGFSSQESKTATEQQIKSQYANLRLSELQAEVQRFARDLLRLMAQIIAGKFQQKTIAEMSGAQLMTQEEKQRTQALIQSNAAQAQQIQAQNQQRQQMGLPAIPPPPPPFPPEQQEDIARKLQEPSWEDVMALLRNHDDFGFRIDIETDSTIATDEQADKEAAVEGLTAIGNGAAALLEAEQAGLIPREVGQEILLSALRKFRFSKEVEEAMERAKNNPQPQQGDPRSPEVKAKEGAEAQAAQFQAQAEQNKARQEQVGIQTAQHHQRKAAAEADLAQFQVRRAQVEAQHEAQAGAVKHQVETAGAVAEFGREQKLGDIAVKQAEKKLAAPVGPKK